MTLSPPPGFRFPMPVGVPSSTTRHELALLQDYAHEAGTVLEIGTHYGFTCIGMALAGAHVTSVDPHYEGPADAPDTWEPFNENVHRHFPAWRCSDADEGGAKLRLWFSEAKPRQLLIACQLASEEWAAREERFRHLPGTVEALFGMAFIDGNHTWPCPLRDARIAMAHLGPPGFLAFHDVTPNWPAVYRAATELEAAGTLRELGRVGTLRVYSVVGQQLGER